MSEALQSSRGRFREYRRRRRNIGASDSLHPAAVAEPETEDQPRRKRSRSFLTLFVRFWGLLAGHRGRVFAALGTLTFTSILALVMPALTKLAIDYAITDTPGPAGLPAWVREWLDVGLPASDSDRVRLLVAVSLVMIGVSLVRVAVGIWGRWHMTRLTKRVQVSLRRRVFDHAVRLPLHRIYQMKSGGVASVLREDAGGAADLLFGLLYNPWRAIVQLTGAMVVLAWFDWRLLAGAVALVPLVWLTHRTWIARVRPVFRDIRHSRSAIDAHATEAFGGMRIVRGFGREAGEAGRFVRGNHFMARQEILAWWWSRIIDIAWEMLIPLASTGVLVYGGLQVVRGTLTIGDVFMFTGFLLMLLGPLEALAVSATDMQNKLAGFDRVLDLLNEEREFAGTPGRLAVRRDAVRGRITLHDVWFTYPGQTHPVIKGVSVDVAPGEVVALVGPSGSGKTTLCNLIARFFDPSDGALALDGVNLKEIDVGSYRRLLGIVEQDVFLFDGTIAENIAYARRDATREQIAAAARAANAEGFIEKLERGYGTLIGERGVRLSGGQKQRIAIARALLADPAILILDEATSSLDTESERLIQSSLSRLMRGRTCFVIAHRLSTIRHADRILVLEDGRVKEMGTHDELLAAGGRYAEFLRMQVEPEGPPRARATV